MNAATEQPSLPTVSDNSPARSSDGVRLTQGRLLAKNTAWNLAGQVLPMLVAVVAVPVLVHKLGLDRFGVLSLAWIVIGYFGLFDLGIGRALTKLVADKLGLDEHGDIPALVWTSLATMLILGAIGALLAVASSRWLLSVLKTPPPLHDESLRTFYLLALSIPIATLTSGFRGILEAGQEFTILTLLRIPLSTFSFLGPLLVVPFSTSLVPIILVLIFGHTSWPAAKQCPSSSSEWRSSRQ
jgi:O-antigen/teichoic acid export membrane protein